MERNFYSNREIGTESRGSQQEKDLGNTTIEEQGKRRKDYHYGKMVRSVKWIKKECFLNLSKCIK